MNGGLTPRKAPLDPVCGHGLSLPERKVMKESRIGQAKVLGIGLVAGLAMNEVTNLDDRRKYLAGGEPGLNTVLGDIELVAKARMTEIVGGLYVNNE